MKYFTKEVKIGLTGAVAIAALFIGLNFLKGINLFKSSNSYYIEFSDIKGLAKSAELPRLRWEENHPKLQQVSPVFC